MQYDRRILRRGGKCPALPLLGLTLAMLLGGTGCGGGGKSAATTTRSNVVRLSFAWSERAAQSVPTRSLTPAANSVVLRLIDAGGFADIRTLNRPTAGQNATVVAEFFGLNEGEAKLTAQAFAGTNGAGETVAESAATLDLSRNQTRETEVSFEPTYSKIVVTPAAVTLNQNQTQIFTAQGVTDSGIVTQPNPKGQWLSSNTATATVGATGKATANQPGVATISFTDSAFGRTGAATLTVRGGDAEVNIQ